MINLCRDGLITIFLAIAMWISNAGWAQISGGVMTDSGPQAGLNGITNSSPTNVSSTAVPNPKTLPTLPPSPEPGVQNHVASLATSDLREYEAQPPEVKRLIASALVLTNLNLGYKYGSSDPKNGGMDCSGTVFYLLNEAGLKDVPREASGMYRWVWTQGRFEAVVSPNDDTFELALLKPGDLLFWTGTYQVNRDPPVTHVMIYLGINRHSGRRVMVGASEGRPFDGKSRYGVSVFDFMIPGLKHNSNPAVDASSDANLTSRFIGYGSIPGLAHSDQTE
jgi:cell wall-associated NlpC family hydrolase